MNSEQSDCFVCCLFQVSAEQSGSESEFSSQFVRLEAVLQGKGVLGIITVRWM